MLPAFALFIELRANDDPLRIGIEAAVRALIRHDEPLSHGLYDRAEFSADS